MNQQDANQASTVRVSAHQPAYLPWLGYFEKIKRCDIFVYLNHVQFEKNSFINRNKIRTAGEDLWLTVPVLQKGHTESLIKDLKIDLRTPWQKKHLKSIYHSYHKAPCFAELYPRLEQLYSQSLESFDQFCFAHLKFWLNELKIETKIITQGELATVAHKSDLVLEICKKLKATHYYSGALGRNYLELPKFSADGIIVEFQDYKLPVYPQVHGGSTAPLGIVDFCMNGGSPSLI